MLGASAGAPRRAAGARVPGRRYRSRRPGAVRAGLLGRARRGAPPASARGRAVRAATSPVRGAGRGRVAAGRRRSRTREPSPRGTSLRRWSGRARRPRRGAGCHLVGDPSAVTRGSSANASSSRSRLCSSRPARQTTIVPASPSASRTAPSRSPTPHPPPDTSTTRPACDRPSFRRAAWRSRGVRNSAPTSGVTASTLPRPVIRSTGPTRAGA